MSIFEDFQYQRTDSGGGLLSSGRLVILSVA